MSTTLSPLIPRQAAEWEPARVVLLCEPRLETLFALLQTSAANFLYPFSLAAGRREHQHFRRTLEALGIRVIDAREALVAAPLERLRAWARQAVTLQFDNSLDDASRAQSESQLQRAIEALDAEALVELLFLRPEVYLAANTLALDPTTQRSARHSVRPADSAYYVRDPLITTARGCAITRLQHAGRQVENTIAEHVLEALGIAPIYRVQPPGCLEGGDFIPCGDFVLQGQGLLTNAEGVRQCLEERVYGFVEVAVVEDPRRSMDEMHLDTYFAMLDRDLAACCETRLSGADEPLVHVYLPEGSPENFRYVLTRSTLFSRYLQEKGVRVIPFSKAEQERFAANGLLVGPRELLLPESVGAGFVARLQAAGVKTHLVPFDTLLGGYGGLHCASQVLVRS